MKNESPLTSLILGFEFQGGWRDAKRSTAVTVLSMLLGGGGSFSAGGPGKGMYSRLYTRVLNRYGWAQNCTAFHSIYNDTGIVGISAMTDGQHVNDMIAVMARSYPRLQTRVKSRTKKSRERRTRRFLQF